MSLRCGEFRSSFFFKKVTFFVFKNICNGKIKGLTIQSIFHTILTTVAKYAFNTFFTTVLKTVAKYVFNTSFTTVLKAVAKCVFNTFVTTALKTVVENT